MWGRMVGPVPGDQLPECPGEVRTYRPGGQHFLGQDDAAHHVGGAHAAVGADVVAPVTDLNPLGLRPEKAPSLRNQNHPRNAAENLEHQPNSPGTGQRAADRQADTFGMVGRHPSLIGKTNDGVSVCASPVRRTAVPAT